MNVAYLFESCLELGQGFHCQLVFITQAEEQEETGYVLDNKEVRPKRTTQNPTHKEIKPCSQTNSTSIKNEDEMDKELILESAKQGKSVSFHITKNQFLPSPLETVAERMPSLASAAVLLSA